MAIRKVSKIGPATLMISLPAKWVKEFNIKKGDELNVLEKETDLIISTSIKPKRRETTISLKNLNKKEAERLIQATYVNGFEIIEILIENTIKDIKKDERINTKQMVKKIISNLVGMEIVEERDTFIKVQDLGGLDEQKTESIIRRIILLIKEISTISLEDILNKDEMIDNKLNTQYLMIQRFILYSKRYFSIYEFQTKNKTKKMYSFLDQILLISKIYRYIGTMSIRYDFKFSKEGIKLLEHSNSMINDFYNFFFSSKPEFSNQILKKREESWKQNEDILNKGNKFDIVLSGKLSFIPVLLTELVEIKYSLDLSI